LGATSGVASVSGISAAAAPGSGAVSLPFFVYHLLFALSWAALTAWLAGRLHPVALGVAIAVRPNFPVKFVVAKGSFELIDAPFCTESGTSRMTVRQRSVAAGRTIPIELSYFPDPLSGMNPQNVFE
jgi:pheromone shutdown protein TraB